MSRSIKKGPFAAPELLKRVDEMNKAGEKKVLKTWSRASTIFPSLVILLLCMTAAVTSACTSPRTWSATSWASSCLPARSAAMPAARPVSKEERYNGSKS